MKKLSDIERAEQILTEADMVTYVQPAEKLPEANASQLGRAYVLVGFEKGRIPSKTYKCVKVGSGYEWKLVNYHEFGALDAPFGLWATSKRDAETGRATVYIHWKDPEDKEDAHWLYTVIVKKLGSEPTSMYDGEIVGYSSVRDQYSKKVGFVDSVDIDTVDDTTDGDDDDDDIIDNSDHVGYVIPKSQRYFYRVFAVTRYGVVTPSENACNPVLTWKEFQRLVQLGIGSYALDVGDVVSVKWKYDGEHSTYIDFQVVAYDNANLADTTKTHSVTFMACDVLFRGSFDCQEPEYALTQDTSWISGKRYYSHLEGSTTDGYTIMDPTGISVSPINWNENGRKAYEKNPCPTSSYGRNSWEDSNIHTWLNSVADADHWYIKPGSNIFDVYESDPTHYGAYGFGNVKFVGFLGALDPDLQEVLANVRLGTSIPLWRRTGEEGEDTLEFTEDKIFLPSYIEIFGTDDPLNKVPEDIDYGEGKQFDIYKLGVVNTRIKTILDMFNTTPDTVDPNYVASGELASWYTRTPVREIDQETKTSGANPLTLECVKVVSCKNIRHDVEHDLGEDIGSGRMPNEPINDTTQYLNPTDNNDYARDKRLNVFRPVGTSIWFRNNSSPGFVPCFVVA